MGCNCGGSFQIQDGMQADDQAPVVGDPSYFWTGATPGVTSDNAEGALVAPNGVPVWDPETGLTDRGA
jgi:hypothetical protein